MRGQTDRPELPPAPPALTSDALFRQQLDSLYSMSIEITRLHELKEVLDRALGYCLELTASQFGFVGLLDGPDQLDVAAIKGFQPSDARFYEMFRLIPVRPSVFGIVITEGRSNISNDVVNDALHVGQPRGHPPVRTFLGVPLRVGVRVIGMVGVANKLAGYSDDDERLLSTFANQVAVAIDNARLYEAQRGMITELEQLHRELDQAERERVVRRERERIAADLHDRIEQALFTIGLKLRDVVEKYPIPEQARTRLRDVRSLSASTVDAVKEVIFALSLPDPLAGELPHALRRMVREIERGHDLEADLVVSGTPVTLDPAREKLLTGVAQEALVNVARHAQARMVLLSLRYSSDHVDLVVQDDGNGAHELLLQNYAESGTHFGLRTMRRQVEEVGGTFEAANGEESGFAVRVRLPI
jgi:signal transduction histidine kinase